MTASWNRPNAVVDDMTAEQLVRFIANGGAQPGSIAHEAVRAALHLRIAQEQDAVASKQLQAAEAQRDAALATVRWTKVQGVATGVATVIALAALLIAAL